MHIVLFHNFVSEPDIHVDQYLQNRCAEMGAYSILKTDEKLSCGIILVSHGGLVILPLNYI